MSGNHWHNTKPCRICPAPTRRGPRLEITTRTGAGCCNCKCKRPGKSKPPSIPSSSIKSSSYNRNLCNTRDLGRKPHDDPYKKRKGVCTMKRPTPISKNYASSDSVEKWYEENIKNRDLKVRDAFPCDSVETICNFESVNTFDLMNKLSSDYMSSMSPEPRSFSSYSDMTYWSEEPADYEGTESNTSYDRCYCRYCLHLTQTQPVHCRYYKYPPTHQSELHGIRPQLQQSIWSNTSPQWQAHNVNTWNNTQNVPGPTNTPHGMVENYNPHIPVDANNNDETWGSVPNKFPNNQPNVPPNVQIHQNPQVHNMNPNNFIPPQPQYAPAVHNNVYNHQMGQNGPSNFTPNNPNWQNNFPNNGYSPNGGMTNGAPNQTTNANQNINMNKTIQTENTHVSDPNEKEVSGINAPIDPPRSKKNVSEKSVQMSGSNKKVQICEKNSSDTSFLRNQEQISNAVYMKNRKQQTPIYPHPVMDETFLQDSDEEVEPPDEDRVEGQDTLEQSDSSLESTHSDTVSDEQSPSDNEHPFLRGKPTHRRESKVLTNMSRSSLIKTLKKKCKGQNVLRLKIVKLPKTDPNFNDKGKPKIKLIMH